MLPFTTMVKKQKNKLARRETEHYDLRISEQKQEQEPDEYVYAENE